jgi:hypothetical protein
VIDNKNNMSTMSVAVEERVDEGNEGDHQGKAVGDVRSHSEDADVGKVNGIMG